MGEKGADEFHTKWRLENCSSIELGSRFLASDSTHAKLSCEGSIVKTQISSDFVQCVRLLHNLTDDEIQQLLEASEELKYAEGQSIFCEGGRGRDLYVVLEGSVRITLAAPATAETELFTVEPGGVFGESSFFHRSVHHATARCLSSVRVLRLQHRNYVELTKSDSLAAYKIAANAADLLGERLQETDDWIERMLQGREDAELLVKWKHFRRGIRRGTSVPISGCSVALTTLD